MYTGKGAGQLPTTSAVVSDIIGIADKIRKDVTDYIQVSPTQVRLVSMGDVKTKGYVRANLKDVPGVLSKVSGVLGKHKINIQDSIQRRRFSTEINGERYIPDIITTDPVENKVMVGALEELSKLDCVKGRPFYLRIEE